MNILEEHNEWEPKEITLDYKVYKDLLSKVVDYPIIIKQLTEDRTHTLLKTVNGSTTVYALVDNEKFGQHKHKFN